MQKIVELDKNRLVEVDYFFKFQFNSELIRYGTIGAFTWKIFSNPNGNGIIFAICDDDNIIVSTTTLTPKSIFIYQKEYLVAEIGDTYTEFNYQGKGFFTQLINHSIHESQNKFDFLYGTPNNQSLPGYLKRTTFTEMKELKVYSYRFQLKIGKVLQPYLGFYISNLFNFLYTCIIQLNINLFSKHWISKRYKLLESFEINSEWEIFWEEDKSQWDFIINRNKHHINWRFRQNPENYQMLKVLNGDKMVGYLVYRYLPTKNGNILVVADFLFLKNHSKCLNICLNKMKKKAVNFSCNSIIIWCTENSIWSRELFKIGFFKMKKVPIIWNKINENIKLTGCKNIHFTYSDSDNI